MRLQLKSGLQARCCQEGSRLRWCRQKWQLFYRWLKLCHQNQKERLLEK
ncbi:hypothetical protein [Rubritalea tangerina]